MLQQRLDQRQLQKLSPQQIQVIKMLEATTLELEEKIRQEIEANPALEEGEEVPTEEVMEKSEEEEGYNTDENEDFSLGDYRNEDDIPDYKIQATEEEKEKNIFAESSSSLNDYLMEQLHLQSLTEEEATISEYVIGNVDQDGYLRRSVEAMVDDYSFMTGKMIPDEKMEAAVKIVQTFEPAGIAAFSLPECLLLQLKRKQQTKAINNAILILTKSFEDFSQKRYKQLESRLNLTQEEIKESIDEIVKLNPKPGSSWESDPLSNCIQITPDFLLENEDGHLILHLNNDNIPPLHVSKDFTSMLEEYTNEKNRNKERKNAILFLKQKMDAAKWFIDAIKQRHETLINTMSAIIERQHDFFLDGDETKLKPLILKDIADMTGYDISTISRVSNSKYIQTEFGIYALKYFFSEKMQTQDGDEVSSNEIRAIVSELIGAEDKSNPLTDDRLTELLKEKGYAIARRTVAKYREQLGFPVARLRKEIV